MSIIRRIADSEGNILKSGDRFKVYSTSSKDGVPEYRHGDIGSIADIHPDGVIEIEYLNTPLRLIRTNIKAFQHFRKLDNN